MSSAVPAMRGLVSSSAAMLRAAPACARGFASSASTSAAYGTAVPSSSRPPQSRAGKRRSRAARDDKLRHAIELFHRAPTFYPSPASTPGVNVLSEETPEAKSALDRRVMDDVLEPYADEGTEDQVFATLATVAANSAREAAGLTSAMASVQQPSALSSQLPKPTPPPEAASTSAMPSATSAATRTYVEQLIQNEETKRTLIDVGFVKPGSVSRASLVRDALYGTSQAERPGLEVLRERAAARKAKQGTAQQRR